jgi:hypothetical protein
LLCLVRKSVKAINSVKGVDKSASKKPIWAKLLVLYAANTPFLTVSPLPKFLSFFKVVI